MKKPERMEVFFEGRVQGVGFRYTTSSIAERFPITGRIRNLDDGRVHLVAEGARTNLDDFLDDIDEALGTYIHRQVVSWGDAREDWTDFAIER